MYEKIAAGLRDVGYEGPLLQIQNLKNSIEGAPKDIEYTKLVQYLTKEISSVTNVDEEVNPIQCPEDSAAFVMELTSFLKELNCPYKSLTQGYVSDRLQSVEDRQLVIDYLLTELMIARMDPDNVPQKMEVQLRESPEAFDLQQILHHFSIPKPPDNLTLKMLFEKLVRNVEILLHEANVELVGKPIFVGNLSPSQWETLENIQNDLHREYKIRKEMLLTRLDVTIQSFQWSDRTKGKDDAFERIYKNERKDLKVEPDVDIPLLLAARTDIAIIEKTSNSSVRKNTSSALQKIIIGQVPDRGGRTNELAPPPPEMPSWQQRTPGPSGGGRGRGGGYSGGGQQSGGFSRGNNNSFRHSNNRNDQGARPTSSWPAASPSGKKPFENFDTSLSSYRTLGGFSSSSDGGGPNKRQRSQYDYTNRDKREWGGSSQKRSFDIAGESQDKGNVGYGDNRSDYHTYGNTGSHEGNKKPKSYDQFQVERSSYSEEYARDNRNNQQYQSRNDSGRGRSNYHRGRGRGNYR